MGVGDFSGFALQIHRGRGEVGIGLVPSLITVISSCGHWSRSLNFDELRFAVSVRHPGFER